MRLPAVAVLLLMLAVALAGCSQSKKDSDRDGISDSDERKGWLVRVDYLRERVEYAVTSDPHSDDTDGDGLPDNEEFLLGLDPTVADTDKDGLTDCQEERHTVQAECEDPPAGLDADGGYRTDPKRADSDAGSDRFIRRAGWFTDHTGTLARIPNSGDGISDGDEINGYTVTVSGGAMRTVTTDPRDPDVDNDGLGDGEEREFHGDPTVPDTDGDGCDDGGDPFPDREERLQVGLRQFTLSSSFGRSVELRFRVFVAGVNVDIPGSFQVVPGQTVTLPEAGAVRPGSCTFPPFQPIVEVQPYVYEAQDGKPLDVTTQNPDASGSLSWDLRSDRFAWGNAFEPADPVRSLGVHGELVLSPEV